MTFIQITKADKFKNKTTFLIRVDDIETIEIGEDDEHPKILMKNGHVHHVINSFMQLAVQLDRHPSDV